MRPDLQSAKAAHAKARTEIQVPSPRLAFIQALCDIKEPYRTGAEADALFVSAMREASLWHDEGSPFYRSLLASSGLDLKSLKTPEDCAKLPPVFANFFKYHEILSIPRQDVSLHLTSSGTSGQKSQIFFDDWSIKSAQRMVDDIFEHYGWVTPEEPTNYLLYSYEPRPGLNVGTSFTDNFLLKYAPPNRVVYALRNTGEGGHEFDPFGAIEALASFAREGRPVRIYGFPAFMHFTLKRMRAMGVPPLRLHPESMTFFGGGWKGHAEEAIAKGVLYAQIQDQLGIANERIRDGFGSVEHCVPYVECHHHHFHVPVWARVVIRDPQSLEPLAHGQTGYLNFLSPFITSVPAHSIMMADLARLHPASACGCGLTTDWFELVGRAGLSQSKSCAIAAAELLGNRS